MGTILLAWAAEAELEAWLDRLGPDATSAERARYRTAVEEVRRQGYAVGLRVEAMQRLQDLYATAENDLYSTQGRRALASAVAALARADYLPPDEDVPRDAPISHVSAPIFGPDGTLLFALVLLPGDEHRLRDLPELSRAVLRSAGRVMAAVDGRHPDVSRARGARAVR
jgi:DNA-binding IclR family transcriptional regulator